MGSGLKYKYDLAALVHPVNTGPWWLEIVLHCVGWIYQFEHAKKRLGTLTLSLLISAMSFCMGFDLSFSALERLNPLASSCSRSSSSNFRRTLLYWRWRCFILAFLGESGSKKYRVKNKLSTSATRWYFTETTNKKWMIIWICVLQRTIANNYKLECPKMGMQ